MTSPEQDEDPIEDGFPHLSLHDALALGEIEAGLLAENREKSEMEEIERLPVLLRILSASRPLASIPTFDDAEPIPGAAPIDEIANEVVARLEDVAANHSIAEGVDVVACHLAPAICRNLSKLSPLKRKRSSITGNLAAASSTKTTGSSQHASNPQTVGWDTSELVVVGANPRSSFKRRRISSKVVVAAGKQNSDEIAAGFSEGALSSEEEDQKGTGVAGIKGRRLSRRVSSELMEVGAEDSQEEVVAKTLSELSALVASALEPAKAGSERDGENRSGKLALASEDSIFLEPVRSHAGGTRGVMSGSDLASTVASLLHHAPVLRHQHVANALCRATVPQAAGLIRKMGANCPTAVPSLLCGCIDAYKSARMVGSRHSSVCKMATSAIRALAELSAREKSRVRTTLQQVGILVDLQLELAISQDPVSAICLLLERLCSDTPDAQEQPGSQEKDVPHELVSNDTLKDVGTHVHGATLQRLLEGNGDLSVAVLHLLRDELSQSIEPADTSCESGRVSLLLRCFAWLMLQCDITLALKDSGMESLVSLLSVLQNVFMKMREAAESSSWPAEPLVLLLCGLILTLGRLFATDKIDTSVLDPCRNLVKECLDFRLKNTKYGTLVARFVFAIKLKNAEACRELLKSVLDDEFSSKMSSIPSAESLELYVSKLYEWLQDGGYDVDAVLKDGLSSTSPHNLSFLLDAIDCSNGAALTGLKDSISSCLTDLLSEANKGATLVDNARAPEFIVKATKYLESVNDINLPIVSPLQLESTARKADFCHSDCPSSGGIFENLFLLQVLYWFAFMDSGSNSLFTYEVRGLPLKELLSFSMKKSTECLGSRLLNNYLLTLVDKHCPEIPRQRKRWELANQSMIDLVNNERQKNAKMRRTLSKTLRKAASGNSLDPSGAMAEKVFLCARLQLSDSVLYSELASALLSTPNAPPPFITYSMLCSDPLVLLKAPMRVWQCLGLRRILLSAMTSLLESNEAVVDKKSPSATGANELISCRHLLLVRCILVTISGFDDSKSDRGPFACSMTSNFIRMIVAKNPGLAGMIVKHSQDFPDASMDWLVEFVPEAMDDSGSMTGVLSGSGSVTSKLAASASILRIIIAHGHRDDAATERLVYAALAQLVSSFFLVLGPVGVPVNVLIGDGSGQDATQISRKATFKMLRSLVNVRGRMRPRMRSECGLALHKLAGLCKGENLLSGVTGAVLARRKGLLREMFEAVNKAANAMGSGMEL